MEHQIAIIDKFVYLKNNLKVSDTELLDHLAQMGVLDSQEMDVIKAKTTEHDRTDALLHCIRRTSQEQYQLFLDALNKSSQEFIAIELQGDPSNRPIQVLKHMVR